MTHLQPVRMMAKIGVFSALVSCALFGADDKVSDSPASISFKPLDWRVPRGEPFRTVLSNGLVAYIAEDKTLPLFSITGYVRYGQLRDPKGKEGLCTFLAALMRTGGTQKYHSDTLDALLDLYAMKAKISAGETQVEFNFSCLSEYTDLCLEVMDQLLLHPVFEEKKIKKNKDLFVEDIYHRFDNPAPVLRAAYEKALYSGMANSRMPMPKNFGSITRADLVTLHKSVFKTENMILAVSGNFVKDTMVRRLGAIFPKTGTPRDSTFPVVTVKAPDKLLFIKKPISQSYVKIGLPFFKRPHPDYYAVSVLNMILGGEGFTSRLGTKIRSDEGLTYSISSNAESNYFFPGTFYIEFFTKSESTGRAIALSLAEIDRLKQSGITADELDHAKKILIDGFPSMFRNPDDIVENYAMNEYLRRMPDHFTVYPDKINALTIDDIRKAAEKYLTPSAFTYVVVGDSAAIFKGDTSAGFSLRKLAPARFIIQDSIPSLP
jgi:zinc protease